MPASSSRGYKMGQRKLTNYHSLAQMPACLCSPVQRPQQQLLLLCEGCRWILVSYSGEDGTIHPHMVSSSTQACGYVQNCVDQTAMPENALKSQSMFKRLFFFALLLQSISCASLSSVRSVWIRSVHQSVKCTFTQSQHALPQSVYYTMQPRKGTFLLRLGCPFRQAAYLYNVIKFFLLAAFYWGNQGWQ
eukprot:1161273-Pelagomonas_calceolata.AAC.1